MTTYLEMVKKDVVNYLNENDWETLAEDFEDFEDVEDFKEQLNDDLWIDDSVTGNASGSYYFNSYKSREAVLANMEEVSTALKEFYCGCAEEVGEMFLDERWEDIDVTTRCYYLAEAIEKAIDDLEIDEYFEKKNVA